MKNIRFGVLLIILQLVTAPIYCNASIAADAIHFTESQLAEAHNHVFIANVTSKIIGVSHTYYVFQVIEYLKAPINTSTIYFTANSGSEIAVSPATIFSEGVEYIIFCDEISEEYDITGNHYQYRLLSSVKPSEIENIRKTVLAEKAAESEHNIAPEVKIIDREPGQPNEQNIDPETVKRNRAETNTLLAIVYICIAGIYLFLIPVMKKGV